MRKGIILKKVIIFGIILLFVGANVVSMIRWLDNEKSFQTREYEVKSSYQIRSLGDSPWWNTNWTYRKQVIINHNQVAGNLVNFPVLVVTTMDTSKVQGDGDDIVFTDTSGTKLNHEIESYSSSTGQLIAWVNIVTLSSTEDTISWMYYGNSYCSNQQNKAGTWDSNYVAVWHFKEKIGNIVSDSTINHFNATANEYTTITDGFIGKARSFDNGDGAIYVGEHEEFGGMSSYSIETYAYPYNINGERRIFDRSESYETNPNTIIFLINRYDDLGLNTNNADPLSADNPFSVNTWTYVAATYMGSGGEKALYSNGVKIASATTTQYGPTAGAFNVTIGDCSFGWDYPWDGKLDEMRFSNIARTSEWIRTSYNSIDSPETFISIGEEETYTPSPNQPPTADAGGPYYANVGNSITFDGSGSSDPDGTIVGYRWDWTNDGTYDTDWLTSATTTHSYYEAGTYTVKLEVKDDDGETDTDTATATITAFNTTFYPTDDSYIAQNHPSDILGSLDYIRTRGLNGWIFTVLVKFDLSSIPEGINVKSATLKLFYYQYIDGNPSGHLLNLYRITSTWDESNATWNTQPSYSSQVTSSAIVPASTEVWMEWNVTDDVQSFIDGQYINYGWELIDTVTSSNSCTYFHPKEHGSYIPILEIKYTVVNLPPTADAGGPYYANLNNSIIFDGSGSRDFDGTITGYRWDFTNDGLYDTDWLTSATTTHSYPLAGTYTVKLEVKDNASETDTDTAIAYISTEGGAIPTAEANGLYLGYVNHPVIFTSAGSIGGSEGTITTWYWTFGDGTVSSQQNPSHTYTSAGTFTVTLKVTNNFGQTDTDTTSATIQELSPDQILPVADAGGPYTGVVGTPITFNGSGSNDPDGTIVSYVWNFGDSTTGTGVSPTHTYTIPGNYTVILTVTDNESLTHSNSTTVNINVSGPPTITIVIDASNIEPIEEENEKTFSVTVQCEHQPVSNIHLEILEHSNLTIISLPSNISLNPGESRELLITIKAPKLGNINNSEIKISDETLRLRAVADGNISSKNESINFKVIKKDETPGFEAIATLAAIGSAGALA
ncbi:MAG: DUF2341 domain-containing protein, partial [Candidatus Thermoplasmatota archaeon]